MEMRRKDRAVTDPARIEEILSACQCCRLGLCDGERAYVVPMNFGYTCRNGDYTLYFHSAPEGRKIDLIGKTGWAGFEMDTNYQLHEAMLACGHSARFQSVIGGGQISFVEDSADKRVALEAIMRHVTGKGQWVFNEKMLRAVCVFRLDVEELSCKEHL